jgi:hypothetical protein
MLRLFLIVALVLAVTAEARSEEEEMPHHEVDRYVLEWQKNFFYLLFLFCSDLDGGAAEIFGVNSKDFATDRDIENDAIEHVMHEEGI